ncbi:MAG: hypothetical protein ACXVBE_02785, partial [Bdellovibrionota bacterium]
MRFSQLAIAAVVLMGVFAPFLLLSPARPVHESSSLPVSEERIPATPNSRTVQPHAVRAKAAANNESGQPGSKYGQLIEDLNRQSTGEWQISWAQGALARLSGGRLPLREASHELAAQAFLNQYGAMIGASSGEFAFESQRQMGGNVQLIYSQKENSVPVFGTRVNMIFDSAQNLIYLSSNAYSGPHIPFVPVFTVEKAAAAARSALADFRKSHGDNGEALSEELLRRNCVLGYRLAGGAISLVYKFSISIP